MAIATFCLLKLYDHLNISELSEVLWDMVLHIGLHASSPALGVIALFVVFFFWASKLIHTYLCYKVEINHLDSFYCCHFTDHGGPVSFSSCSKASLVRITA